MSARKHLHIGVFIPSPSAAQLLDTACIDVFAIGSYQYLSPLPMVPSHLSSLAPEMTISYIGSQKPGENPGIYFTLSCENPYNQDAVKISVHAKPARGCFSYLKSLRGALPGRNCPVTLY